MGVFVLFMLATLFIPLHYKMYDIQQERKHALHASATMLEAVKQHGIATTGTHIIDGISYHWRLEGQRICVRYTDRRPHERCVS
ncbi:hypothetical protein CH76_02195 [Lysinibacillus sp. BF-4]|uniref:hypothetical protein n=1 Tax=Lysinibacillus sp. BF-4 TaxID=1473546 RepID=UPI0005030DFC|nr:hypothetical protein [Lysinibacillus sp. BF-4]KFL44627.1 hypothetical protein CH76_02195 [Lysinibacillus sp. BF-4]